MVPTTEASLIESNRALVLLKAGHHLEAAAATERALERDPRNVKAAYRRAQALLELPGAGAKEIRAAEEAVRARHLDVDLVREGVVVDVEEAHAVLHVAR